MLFKKLYILVLTAFIFASCKDLQVTVRDENSIFPENYAAAADSVQDSLNTAEMSWQDFFQDPYLIDLIDSALINNQELNIMLQEIAVSKNEIRAKKGEYLPTANGILGAGLEKTSRYTRNGAVEANNEIVDGKEFPEPLGDFTIGIQASWEIDVWKKLRNAKKAAVTRYLSSIEGKNFMVTNLISEIANEYYELLALDNQLTNIDKNIEIQSNALSIVEQQKEAAKVTELAVSRFRAQLYNTKSLKFEIEQRRIETINKLNFLTGRFPQPILRNSEAFNTLVPLEISDGLPTQLLDNRTDIRQAELQLAARKLDVQVAKAQFYPSFRLSAGVGLQAFNPTYLVKSPQSLLYSLAGDMVAPLINRNAIKAEYFSANSKQLQSIYEYEETILKAYLEVSTQLSKIDNLAKTYEFKALEVEALTKSITISNDLFTSARADYMEILMTQRDALEAQFELIETKKLQLNATVNTYRALGGGWR